MFTTLNATNYPYGKTFYNAEFERILSKVVACYDQMIGDNIMLPDNENAIRDLMLKNYLKSQTFKEQVHATDYLFDPELPENSGRIDIRVMPLNPFINDHAYYIIECKRINAANPNGTTGLNGEYVSEGVCRFVSEKYSCYYKTNAMLGFVTASINIHENMTAINSLMINSFTESNIDGEVIRQSITSDFHYSYCSTHSCSSGRIIIYHLMLDFSKNIQQ